MGLISNLTKGIRQKKEVFEEAKLNNRVNKFMTQREKTSDEILLENYLESERQKQITEQVREIKKQQLTNHLKDMSMLSGDNMFNGKNDILQTKNSMLSDKNIFNQKAQVLQDNKKLFSLGRVI